MRLEMATARALLTLLAIGVAGCRFFEPGLGENEDAGSAARPPREDGSPPPWPGPDAARLTDSVSDRRPDEPSIPGPPSELGCADGSREAFASVAHWGNVAGCAGAWTVPGLLSPEARTPSCGRAAGNDGANRWGEGCSVADLCALGWHVCRDASEVGRQSGSGCESALLGESFGFFLVLAGASAQGICSPDRQARNDLHGCGNLGQPQSAGCQPLNRRMTFADCQASGVWSCGGLDDHLMEAALVTKKDPTQGGALCCRDN
jgi:hypothetical protein